MSRRRWVALGVFLVGALIALTYFGSPDRVVVASDCRIINLHDGIRAELQGRKFWDSQLIRLKLEIGEEQKLIADLRETRARQDEAAQRARLAMEALYQDLPAARPSPAHQQAEALRALADRVEQHEVQRLLFEASLQRIAELQQIQSRCLAR